MVGQGAFQPGRDGLKLLPSRLSTETECSLDQWEPQSLPAAFLPWAWKPRFQQPETQLLG